MQRPECKPQYCHQKKKKEKEKPQVAATGAGSTGLGVQSYKLLNLEGPERGRDGPGLHSTAVTGLGRAPPSSGASGIGVSRPGRGRGPRGRS
jgi:hypothetical protein